MAKTSETLAQLWVPPAWARLAKEVANVKMMALVWFMVMRSFSLERIDQLKHHSIAKWLISIEERDLRR
jgi:hypothetical protein